MMILDWLSGLGVKYRYRIQVERRGIGNFGIIPRSSRVCAALE